MSAAFRLALFSLLLIIHSARPMSVAKVVTGSILQSIVALYWEIIVFLTLSK